MGWSIGFDTNWQRDIGYGVPAICDHPECEESIDRGLGYVCGSDVRGGEHGCGLFFCGKHLYMEMPRDDDGVEIQSERECQLCKQCLDHNDPFEASPDTEEWITWKLTDKSWQQWRNENPAVVEKLRAGQTVNPTKETARGN